MACCCTWHITPAQSARAKVAFWPSGASHTTTPPARMRSTLVSPSSAATYAQPPIAPARSRHRSPLFNGSAFGLIPMLHSHHTPALLALIARAGPIDDNSSGIPTLDADEHRRTRTSAVDFLMAVWQFRGSVAQGISVSATHRSILNDSVSFSFRSKAARLCDKQLAEAWSANRSFRQ